MKSSILRILVLVLISSCTAYQTFITVNPRSDIPNGTQNIILNEDIEIVKQAFKKSGTMVKSLEGGFETEEILIDEGTRAMYKVHEFDEQVRVTAFWGITQKVKSEMVVWAGADAASAYDVHSWDQVVYDRDVKRPKRVFDYAIQIIEAYNLNYTLR